MHYEKFWVLHYIIIYMETLAVNKEGVFEAQYTLTQYEHFLEL